MISENVTIKVEELTKSYGELIAVDRIRFSVNKGQIFGLLGPNGAGKTTTLECILGTKSPDEGTVEILGLDPVKDRRKVFEKVGVQFQESAYQDKITVGELCESTAALYKHPANYEELLTRFDLSEKKKSQVNELSGGQRQRLFIVLALIPNPEILFLDELTTGLDAKARREVWKYLEKLKQEGMTILLTSHFMDEVEILCDQILIIKKGKCVFYGTVEEAVAISPEGKLEDAYLWYTEEEGNHESI